MLKPYKKIDLDQRSSEWLAFRQMKIGASDAPIIMGVSPYKTPYELYLEKIGFGCVQSPSFSMQYGIKKESEILERFNSFHVCEVFYEPAVLQSTIYHWAIASLDGYNGKSLVEIKCANKIDHECALQGEIPAKYVPQIQFQFFVTGFDKGYYVSYNENLGEIHIKTVRNDAYIAEMIAECEKFYQCMTTMTPPPLCARDRIRIDHKKMLIDEYNRIKSQIAELELDLDRLKSEITVDLQAGIYSCDDTHIDFIESKGRVQYDKIPELANVDLEYYRSEPTRYWKIQQKKIT